MVDKVMQIPSTLGPRQLGLAARRTRRACTAKVPPACDSRWQRFYPLKNWARNVSWWASARELPDTAQGAAVILRFEGVARELRSTLDPQTVRDGGTRDLQDGVGMRQFSGLAILFRGLQRQVAPLDAETSTPSIAELMSVRRMPGEDVDTTLGRSSSLQFRAAAGGNLVWGPSGFAWLLLSGLRVPPSEWVNMLVGFRSDLPDKEAQFNQLLSLIRRAGHVRQRGRIATAAMAGGHGGGRGLPAAPRGHGQGQVFFSASAVGPGQAWDQADGWTGGALTIRGMPAMACPTEAETSPMGMQGTRATRDDGDDRDGDCSSSAAGGDGVPQHDMDSYLSSTGVSNPGGHAVARVRCGTTTVAHVHEEAHKVRPQDTDSTKRHGRGRHRHGDGHAHDGNGFAWHGDGHATTTTCKLRHSHLHLVGSFVRLL
ncbi:unnamed protein product [Prorocentrum cordatum]|uniref:Uncharacterized protein n=1 Tax=Prorocentrum cordatum TaxID=2364126 RepID=A0ABN9QLX0_9DINO|nr:unnamed protein product [Polarella glacialis]